MKKANKWLGLKIATGALVALTPLSSLVACNNATPAPTPAPRPQPEAKLFNIENGVLKGFANNTTQEDINQYVNQNGGKFVIPNNLGITTIGSYAFSFKSSQPHPYATAIEIPNSVVVIMDHAFHGSTQVEHIEWTGTGISQLQYIGKGAFTGCESLTTFAFPKTLVTGNSDQTQKHGIADNAFEDCKSLATLDFSAFKGDDGLTNLRKLRIGHNAFTSVYNHEWAQEGKEGTIILPKKSAEENFPTTDENNLSVGAFKASLRGAGLPIRYKETDGTGKITYNDFWKFDTNSYDEGSLTHYNPVPVQWLVVESNELKAINPAFYSELGEFNTLYIPSKIINLDPEQEGEAQVTDITSINANFNLLKGAPVDEGGCPKSLRKNNSLEHLWIEDGGISAIPSFMCANNNTEEASATGSGGFKTALKTVRLPSTALTIGAGAFNRCTSLTTINLNEATGLTAIGDDAFFYDIALSEFSKTKADQKILTLSNSVNTIGGRAFMDCHNIEGIKLHDPEGTLNLGRVVFANWNSLKTIDLSGLTYYYDSEHDVSTGSFVEKWMIAGNAIFNNAPVQNEEKSRKIILPKATTKKEFLGCETIEESILHPNSGFNRLTSQSESSEKPLFTWYEAIPEHDFEIDADLRAIEFPVSYNPLTERYTYTSQYEGSRQIKITDDGKDSDLSKWLLSIKEPIGSNYSYKQAGFQIEINSSSTIASLVWKCPEGGFYYLPARSSKNITIIAQHKNDPKLKISVAIDLRMNPEPIPDGQVTTETTDVGTIKFTPVGTGESFYRTNKEFVIDNIELALMVGGQKVTENIKWDCVIRVDNKNHALIVLTTNKDITYDSVNHKVIVPEGAIKIDKIYWHEGKPCPFDGYNTKFKFGAEYDNKVYSSNLLKIAIEEEA